MRRLIIVGVLFGVAAISTGCGPQSTTTTIVTEETETVIERKTIDPARPPVRRPERDDTPTIIEEKTVTEERVIRRESVIE